MKRNYQPKNLICKRRHGFRYRLKNKLKILILRKLKKRLKI